MRMIIAGTLTLVMIVGMASSHVLASPSPQATLERTYSNAITATFAARELGIPATSILGITIGARGAGCSITFAQPITTHTDLHRSATGVDNITLRQQFELTESQAARLDEIMRTQGCFNPR